MEKPAAMKETRIKASPTAEPICALSLATAPRRHNIEAAGADDRRVCQSQEGEIGVQREIHSEALRELHAYWQEIAKGDGLPSLKDVDPVEIPHLLKGIYLIDVTEPTADFRVRLMGTHIVDVFDKDYTGQAVADFDLDGESDAILAEYEKVVDGKEPALRTEVLRNRNGELFRYERLLLPLSSNGVVVDTLLGGLFFHQPW